MSELSYISSGPLVPGGPRREAGLEGSTLAYRLAELFRGRALRDRPNSTRVVVLPQNALAERLSEDVRFFLGEQEHSAEGAVCFFSTWEVLPFDALSPTSEISAGRLHTLNRLLTGRPSLVIASVEALMQRLVPPAFLRSTVATVTVGDLLDREGLIEILERGGYQRASLVEEVGQLAVRGAVVDFFPPGAANPLRVELFSGAVDSLRDFDAGTQRSLSARERFEIVPVRELALPQSGEEREACYLALRARASEQGLPLSAAKSVEEAVREDLPLPGLEQLQPFFTDRLSTFWDYLPGDAEVYVFEESAVIGAADDFAALVETRAGRAVGEGRVTAEISRVYLSPEEFSAELVRRASRYFDLARVIGAGELEAAEYEESGSREETARTIFTLASLRAALRAARQSERPFLPLAEEVRHRFGQRYRVAIAVSHPSRERRIADLLGGYGIHVHQSEAEFPQWIAAGGEPRPEVVVIRGELSAGVRLSAERAIVIAERELFPETSTRKQSSAARNIRRFLGSVSQLKEDDFVVHVDHGIAIYRGLRQIDVDGKTGDFLHLEYADEAKLFVPVENIGKIQKYAAADARRPALSKLGGKAWTATKAKVRENVAELAGQLLKLLAERELAPGIPFGEVGSEDLSFADSFAFEETPDQSRAIEEVLADLTKSRPMDRLVCGDVGYGKTEVAIRAIYKVVHEGKQAAVLVPTTILAEQHFQTFKSRFADYPFRVECVSRFNSAAENKQILADVSAGRVDVVIGTHRLLQRDVLFKDLGLLVIDEEHRFGVAHKEKLKRLRAEVHVLTLTATPIPRTLHMSLVGIRDLSIIETPPVNRQVIRTYLATYNEGIVREAITRELSRAGQVFYLYNRVGNIAAIADEVAELVPEATVAFAHGQMKEAELESVMHRFVTGEVNVLVTTTIIESGLDIPNANTIIIRNAERFGLAELYQLRGRVGRSSRRAYAYLLIPDPKTLGSDAKKRLQVLQSLDDLGIGFRLAIQDMEIRGAGNLLGKDQSGHIDLVGYELYSRILKDAVEELRRTKRSGTSVETPPRPVIDPEVRIGYPAHIPPWYVPDVAERLLLYQRLIELRDAAEGALILEEIADRFGHPPEEIGMLIELMVFRGLLRRAGIVSANYRGESLSMAFHPLLPPEPSRVVALVRSSGGSVKVSPAMTVSVHVPADSVRGPKDFTAQAEALFRQLGVIV